MIGSVFLTTCGHTVCDKCLDRWIDENKGGRRCHCPVCRKVFDIPEDKAEGITTNFHLMKLADKLKTPQPLPKPSPTEVQHMCDKHPNEELKFYCTNCHVPFCRDCAITKHAEGHHKIDIQEAAGHDISNLECIIRQANDNNKAIKNQMKACQDDIQLVEKEAADMITDLNETRRQMHLLIDKHYDNLESQVQTTNDNNVSSLMQLLGSLADQSEQLTNHTQVLMKQKTLHPVEIIKSRHQVTQIKSNLAKFRQLHLKTHLRRSHHKKPAKLEDSLSKLTWFDCTPTWIKPKFYIKNKVEKRNQIGTAPKMEDMCILQNGDVVTAYYEGGIDITDPITKQRKYHVDMTCSRVATFDNKIFAVQYGGDTKVKVLNERGDIQRTLQCVSLAQCVAAAPDGQLAVFHGHSSTGNKLSFINTDTDTVTSTCNIKSSTKIQWMVVNSRKEVIISYGEYNIVMGYNKDGEVLFTYDPNNTGGNKLIARGTCVDKFDNIMVAGDNTNTVQLLSPRGDFIKLLVTPQDNIKCPLALTVDEQGHLLVGEYWSGKIHQIKYIE